MLVPGLGLSVCAAPLSAAQVTDTTVTDTTASVVRDTVPADTTPPETYPIFPTSASQAPGSVVLWQLDDLLNTGAVTLGELLEFETPLDPIRVGFLEGPQAMVFAGGGPRTLRLTIDGYEIAPLGGGPLDTHTIALADVQRLQLVREPGGYHLSAQAYRRRRPEAYSRVEGGTGDRDTNMLRAYFNAQLLGAVVDFGLDRIDTDGASDFGSADYTGVRGSIALPLPGDLWGQLEFRRTTVGRERDPAPQRTDWVVRLRRSFEAGWYADLIAGVAQLQERPRPVSGTTDPLVGIDRSARQLAFRGARVADRWRGVVAFRFWDADGFPRFTPEASLELDLEPIALFARGRYADWEDFATSAGYAAVSLKLPLGFRALGELEDGDQGLIQASPSRRISFNRWSLGLQLSQLDWIVTARAGRWKVDPSTGFGAPFDSANISAGGRLGVFRASARGPLFRFLGGRVELGGGYRNREAGEVLYWPDDEWRVEGLYHNRFLEGQLEVKLRGVAGVRGPMRVPDPQVGPETLTLTADLAWFWSEIIVRVRDVRIFLTYEVYDATAGPRDLPGFGLPRARTHFGLKWEFWN